MRPEAPQVQRLSYRPDVDGLRAVAVLLVIFGHLKQYALGGYIGVDIFFVISGYLISAHILSEMREGRFSIVTFYERRIRRIFPALLVMLAFTSLLAWRYLYPSELADYARSLIAAIFSVSNLLFWHQAGYFDAPSLVKPLLHTWSLAVEEQFYVFFPLFLVLIRKFLPTRLKSAIFAFTGITFALSVYYVHRDASAAFFFAPLRAWELLFGTILSQHYLPDIRRAICRHIASVGGLLLIFIPAFVYTEATPFPGLAALPPCLGAALLIAAGETGPSLGGRLLSLRPVVFVGLISYSLYLWHWPILVFQTIGNLLINDPDSSRRVKIAIFAVSLLLGYLSWRFVETPFRKGRFRPARTPLFLVNGAAVALLSLAAVAALLSHGAPRRFPADALRAASYLNTKMDAPYNGGTCFFGPDDQYRTFQPAACFHDVPGKKTYLLMGDSHAGHLWPGLHAVFPELNLSEASASYCPVLTPEGEGRPACRQIVDYLYQQYLPHHSIDTLILAGRWIPADIPQITAFLAYARAHRIPVLLVGPALEYDTPLPRLVATSLRDHDPGLPERHRLKAPQRLDAQFAALARDTWHVPYLSIYDDLCTPAACPALAAPGIPLLFDTHHFTPEGSLLLAQSIRAHHQLP